VQPRRGKRILSDKKGINVGSHMQRGRGNRQRNPKVNRRENFIQMGQGDSKLPEESKMNGYSVWEEPPGGVQTCRGDCFGRRRRYTKTKKMRRETKKSLLRDRKATAKKRKRVR